MADAAVREAGVLATGRGRRFRRDALSAGLQGWGMHRRGLPKRAATPRRGPARPTRSPLRCARCSSGRMYSICPRSSIMLHMSRVGARRPGPRRRRPASCGRAALAHRRARPARAGWPSRPRRCGPPRCGTRQGDFTPASPEHPPGSLGDRRPCVRRRIPGAGPQGRALQSPFPAGADSHQLCASRIGRAQGTRAESPLPRRGPAAIRAYASPAHIHGQGHKFLTPFNAVRGCRRGLPSQF